MTDKNNLIKHLNKKIDKMKKERETFTLTMTDKFNLAQADKEKALRKRDEKIEEAGKL